MPITASKLRSNLYNLLGQVLETGTPLEIELKGRQLLVLPAEQTSKLSRLVTHDCIKGDPQDLVHNDWSGEWKHDLP